jgi:ribosome-binding factor A
MAAQRTFERASRVAAQLRREVGLLVHQAVREYGIPSVSVSEVEVSRDLAHARVFVVASRAEEAPASLAVLNGLAREMRQRLGRLLRMRQVPELSFHYDESLDRGERIEWLLRKAREGEGGDEPKG